MSDTKEFPTLDVVTVATGTLVSDRGVDSVYEVCGWMLDDRLMTHQLPNASRTLEPYILQEHPWILMLDLPKGDVPALKAVCAQIVEEHGDTVTLTRPDEVEWVPGNATADLEQIAGKRRILQVDLDEVGRAEMRDSGTVIPRITVDTTGIQRGIEEMKRSLDGVRDVGAEAASALDAAFTRLSDDDTRKDA